jgi:hypothetical protein
LSRQKSAVCRQAFGGVRQAARYERGWIAREFPGIVAHRVGTAFAQAAAAGWVLQTDPHRLGVRSRARSPRR